MNMQVIGCGKTAHVGPRYRDDNEVSRLTVGSPFAVAGPVWT
ncbi:hypothetical protein [Roseobacter sp. GAI101]|nr:hypothetical protein [Roseobacter sp. GAI101]EEB85034.1 hypothetical protein RGAI101_2184 [Roseobacter sp. GAI101]